MVARLRRAVWLQRLLLWVIGLLWWPRRVSSSEPARVALLRFDRRVGEALLQTPLFTALHRSLPTAERVAVVHPATARLFEGQPHIDEVMPFSLRGWPLSAGSWRSMFALSRLRCDVAIDCSNYTELSTSHAVATLMTRAGRRIGFARSSNASLCYTHPVAPRVGIESERLQRLHLLSALGISDEETQTRYEPVGTPRPAVVELLEELRGRRGRVGVVNPGGRLAWRRVAPETLAGAARRLVEQGLEVIVVWGPGEEALAQRLVDEVGAGARVAPATDLDELAALFRAAGCTLTNNSGPMHLSVAVGAPTLAVFLEMPSARWGYPDPPHAVVDLTGITEPARVLRHAVDRFLDNLR